MGKKGWAIFLFGGPDLLEKFFRGPFKYLQKVIIKKQKIIRKK